MDSGPISDLSGLTPVTRTTGEATSSTLDGLTPFTDHYFAVVSINISGAGNPVVSSMLAERLTQTIDFPPLTLEQITGLATIPLAATASSGLPIGFSATPVEVATIDGASLTVLQGGAIVVTARQDGSASYWPAEASQTLRLPPLIQALTAFC